MRCPKCDREFEAELCPLDGARLVQSQSLFDRRYSLIERIGAGAMGVVYRARDLDDHTDVAIKMLRADGDDRQRIVARFRREAEIISKLRSESSLRLISFGTTPEGVMYLVTELLRGQSLDQMLDQPLPALRTLRIMAEVCISLDEAHELGIIHRDLKPANIFVMLESERVKVLDFGVANILPNELRSTHSIPTQLTDDGSIVGTPGYMSPEQVRALPLDRRSDLYSLGAVAYHCLAGRPPFVGTPGRVAVSHATTQPKSFSKLESPVVVDPRVEALVTRLLSKAPDQRPASARVLCDEIGELIGALGGPWITPRRWWKLW